MGSAPRRALTAMARRRLFKGGQRCQRMSRAGSSGRESLQSSLTLPRVSLPVVTSSRLCFLRLSESHARHRQVISSLACKRGTPHHMASSSIWERTSISWVRPQRCLCVWSGTCRACGWRHVQLVGQFAVGRTLWRTRRTSGKSFQTPRRSRRSPCAQMWTVMTSHASASPVRSKSSAGDRLSCTAGSSTLLTMSRATFVLNLMPLMLFCVTHGQ
mmetsp:Transcript_101466/g.178626  ORF Transcript_101466/g.178626 Transcript_101466/m.178626 type:complete len:215 (+) Transcript_101466:557-1201(+)